MPFMRVNVARKLTDKQKKDLSVGLTEAIRHIPGKEPYQVIVCFDDSKSFYLGGEECDDYVFIDMDFVGKFDYKPKYDFSVALFKAAKEVLGIPEERMSMKIGEHLGWAGFGDYVDTDEDGKPVPR